jgi:general stress protein CsbA
MLYNFFNILTITVLYGTAFFLIAALICAGIIKFLEADWETRCFVIFMAVVVLSMGFQMCNKIISDSKKQETEQHKINS